jgi:hypothetical protein
MTFGRRRYWGHPHSPCCHLSGDCCHSFEEDCCHSSGGDAHSSATRRFRRLGRVPCDGWSGPGRGLRSAARHSVGWRVRGRSYNLIVVRRLLRTVTDYYGLRITDCYGLQITVCGWDVLAHTLVIIVVVLPVVRALGRLCRTTYGRPRPWTIDMSCDMYVRDSGCYRTYFDKIRCK